MTTSGNDERIGKTVLDDLRRGGLSSDFRQDWRSLQEFYLDADRRARLKSMGFLQRWVTQTFWLMKRLILSLTPNRRLLLILALLLSVIGPCSYRSNDFQTRFDLWPGVLIILLLIVMLELKDKLLARSELEAGRKVQSALLPRSSPVFPGWDIWLFTRPANDVGGDLVDYIDLENGRLGIALGDVAGKGLGAALLMAKLQATLRALLSSLPSVVDLGNRLNAVFCREGLPQRFASLIYLELSADAGEVAILNAGHIPPLLLRAEGQEALPHGGPALGLMMDAQFAAQGSTVGKGEVLIVYSDGVVEARNANGDFFGDERLLHLCPQLRTGTAAESGASIVEAVDRFVGNAARSDDLSLIVLRRTTG